MKIFPEYFRWINEQDFINWLEGMRDSCKSKCDQSLIQYLIDHLDQLSDFDKTITINVKIGDE